MHFLKTKTSIPLKSNATYQLSRKFYKTGECGEIHSWFFFFSNTEWIICKTDSQTKSIRLCFGNEASPSNGLSPARSIGTHYLFRQTCCSWKYWVRLIHKNKNWQSTSASLISCYAPALLIALLKQYEFKRQMKKIIWLKVNYFYIHFIELSRGKIRVSKL